MSISDLFEMFLSFIAVFDSPFLKPSVVINVFVFPLFFVARRYDILDGEQQDFDFRGFVFHQLLLSLQKTKPTRRKNAANLNILLI